MSDIRGTPPWLAEAAAIDDRIAQQKSVPPQKQPKATEVPGRSVEAIVTVYAPIVGRNRPGQMATETFPATVRTRLIYNGRPMFLAADPEVKP